MTSITDAIESAQAATAAAEMAAVVALRDTMVERGWSAVEVDCESMSMIRTVRDAATGEWIDIDTELAENFFDVAGWVPKSLYAWVGGDVDYIITRDVLDAEIRP